jgi:acyl-CoA hydrolase
VRGEVVKVGTTSMTVDIEVTQEDMYTGSQKTTNRAVFIMVALGSDGRGKPVPRLEEVS